MKYQQILIMATRGATMRSEATGWSAEDGRSSMEILRYQRHEGLDLNDFEHVSKLAAFKGKMVYATPLHALADGWQLLSPPTLVSDEYEWWFSREAPSEGGRELL